MYRLGWTMLFAASALTAAGCDSNGRMTKVQGVLTLDGKPVEGAQVSFVPPQGGPGRYAIATTGSDGSFQLTTITPNDGALPGDYAVVVVYEEGFEVPPATNMKDAKAGFLKARQKPKKAPKYVIPPQYGDAAKTPLRQKVPAEGPVKLEVHSAGK